MKKKLIFPSLVLIISGSVIYGGIYFSHNKVNAEASPINLTKITEGTDTRLQEIPKNYHNNISNISANNFVTKEKALDVANGYMLNSIKNATIKTQLTLLSCDNGSISMLEKSEVDANPILNATKKISDIPVWAVSYEGLNQLGLNSATINQRVIFIDAITGRIMYSLALGTGGDVPKPITK